MSCKLPFKIFSGEASEYLAKRICQSLDSELGNRN
ncbi:MAG: ribose-phosphate pyrophosphokinase, partial [Prevotellaceae bacterium]|nr:ribose-phosphate pyrophosphokinase [Prevotellaceae bacterium]